MEEYAIAEATVCVGRSPIARAGRQQKMRKMVMKIRPSLSRSRRVGVTLLLLAVFSLLVGAVAGAQPMEIEFWYPLGGDVGQVIESQTAQFNASQNEIKVNAVYSGDYWQTMQRLQASLIAGNPPEVVVIEINAVPQFADSGALLNLDDFVGSGDAGDFVPGLALSSTYNGSFYALPYARSTPIYYYNRDMARAAGLEGPPETFDDIRRYAAAMHEARGNRVSVWGAYQEPHWWGFLGPMWSNGGELLNEDYTEAAFDQAPVVEVLEQMRQFLYEDGTATVMTNWGQLIQDFALERVAIAPHTTGSLGLLRELAEFDYAATYLPRFKENAVPTGGGDIAIVADISAERQQAAWQFIHWLTDTQQTAAWSRETGYLPVRTSAVQLPEMQAFYEQFPNAKVAFDQLQFARHTPPIPEMAEILTYLADAVEAVMVNNEDPAAALSAAAAKANALLQER